MTLSENAKKILDKNHHGLSEIKDRILEYVSVLKLNQEKGEGKIKTVMINNKVAKN